MIITIILLGVLLVFLILGAGLIKTREMEQENRVIQSYMASMEDFYTGIQSRIEATRKYRHDLAKHIQTLEALLGQQKDAQEMAKYMMNLKKRYDTCEEEVTYNGFRADLMLSHSVFRQGQGRLSVH